VVGWLLGRSSIAEAADPDDMTDSVAGGLSDGYGCRPALIARWLVGLPVPLLVIWVCLGLGDRGQRAVGHPPGSYLVTTVIMKIDLVGPARRAVAMGLNEAVGYDLAATTPATEYLAARWRRLLPSGSSTSPGTAGHPEYWQGPPGLNRAIAVAARTWLW
jgi:hypothetical protein